MGATEGVSKTREEEVEDIAKARALEQRQKEEAEEGDTEETQEEIIEETEVEQESESELPTIEFYTDDGELVKIPANVKYRAKVFGEEQEVPIEQVLRSYQKGAAGDKKLEEAARRLRELEQKERALTEREKQFVEQAEKLKQSPAATKDDYRAKAKTLLAALTDVDEQDPEGRIAELLKDLAPKTNPEEISQQAVQKALQTLEQREREKQSQRTEQERLKANKRFESEYKDIIEDPMAYAAAKTIAAQKWAERPDAAPWEIAQEVGNEVRAWRKTITPQKKKPVTTKTTSTRASIGDDVKPDTREDVLAAMRQARHQPT